MATTKNLCAQIPIDLHERVSEERERLGQTTSEYIANLIQEYYDMIENQKGGIQMTEKGRTMAPPTRWHWIPASPRIIRSRRCFMSGGI